ncbi:MAG: HlyD family secretion protein [Gemmatimonadaceae bacterium]
MATAVSSSSGTRSAPDVSPDAPQKGRRPVVLGVFAVLALVAGTFAYQKWSYGQVHVSTDNAQVDGHIVPVLARASGFVSSVRGDENTRVREGDTLVWIDDDSEYRVRLASAQADLEAARVVAGGRGVVGQSAALVESATNQRASLESQVRAAQATYQKAQADLARLKELADKQVVSRQQLDAAQWAVTNASATIESLERQSAGAAAGLTGAEAGTRLAQARLRAAASAVDNAALQLSYTAVVSPRTGIISRRQVEPGQLVQAGQPLLTVVDDRDIWVTANFKETQLERIKIGQPVDLDIDAFPDCHAKGAVESVSAATGARFALLPPDNATGNFTKVVQRVPVRIRITQGCGDVHPLRPGMSLTVHVITT